MPHYQDLLNTINSTPQSQKARPDQVANNAGGYGFAVDHWQQLDRFLILGTEAGTYYVRAEALTLQNLDAVKKCIAEDGERVVSKCAAVSQEGRAIKNDPAILVLAACIAYGNYNTKHVAKIALPLVCRTGTHILHFVAYAVKLRRWGRALRSAVAGWYERFEHVDSLAYQMAKYQQRDGWSHGDLIRLSHVGSGDTKLAALFDWALHGYKGEKSQDYPAIIRHAEQVKIAFPQEIANLIEANNLPREIIPTDKLNDPRVARALALKMPMTAMIRNLGNMSKQGLLVPGDPVLARVLSQLDSEDALRKARVHPISILIALKTYASGHGVRGSSTWAVTPQVLDALNRAFYTAFKTVEPTGKNILMAIDLSGSMSAEITDTPGMSATEAAAAMALVTARTEKMYTCWGFDTNHYDLPISPNERLDDVIRRIASTGGGGTNVSLPIARATAEKRNVDAIIIYTDSETWAGPVHPYQQMAEYRRTVNPKAKLIYVAATANNTKLNIPDDPLSITVIGFDTTVPEVIRTFLVQ